MRWPQELSGALSYEAIGLDMVKSFVWSWWGFLKKTLVDNSIKPPDSLSAAMYTKTRREAREDTIPHFIGNDDIRSQASDIPERRVNRDLNCVFLQMEFVSEGCRVLSTPVCTLGKLGLRRL